MHPSIHKVPAACQEATILCAAGRVCSVRATCVRAAYVTNCNDLLCGKAPLDHSLMLLRGAAGPAPGRRRRPGRAPGHHGRALRSPRLCQRRAFVPATPVVGLRVAHCSAVPPYVSPCRPNCFGQSALVYVKAVSLLLPVVVSHVMACVLQRSSSAVATTLLQRPAAGSLPRSWVCNALLLSNIFFHTHAATLFRSTLHASTL